MFAAWISNKILDPGWVRRFEDANTLGIQNISRVLDDLTVIDFDLHSYFTQNLSYDMNEKKKEGLELFLKLLPDRKKIGLPDNIIVKGTDVN